MSEVNHNADRVFGMSTGPLAVWHNGRADAELGRCFEGGSDKTILAREMQPELKEVECYIIE